MGDLAKPALTLRIMDKLKNALSKEDLKIIKQLLKKEKPQGKKNLNQGGTVMKKKKYQRGGFEQGFRAREDESLGMRTGPARTRLQDMAARRADSYGAWGRRPNQFINRDKGGAVIDAAAMALEDAKIMNVVAVEDAKSKLDVATDKPSYAEGGVAAKAIKELLGERSRTISNADRKRAEEILTGESSRTISNADRKRLQEILNQNAKGGVASFDVGGTAEEIAEAEAKPSVYQPEHQGEGGPNLDATMLLRKGRAIARIEGGDRHEELVEIAEGKWNVEFESLMDNQGSEIDPDLKKRMRSMQEQFNANFLGGVQNVGTATVIEGHDSASSLGETDEARGMGAAVKGTGFKGVF